MRTIDTYSLHAHMEKFGSNQACHDYLVNVRWNGRPQCPKCGNNHMNYHLKKENSYKCSNCCREFSTTQGTIFHKSKIPLSKWFLAIYFFTVNKRGISSIQLGKFLGIKQQSAWYLLRRLREAMRNENDIILNGITEADESFITPKVNRDKRLQVAKRIHDEEQDKIHGYSKRKRYAVEGGKRTRGRKKGTTKEVVEQNKIIRDGKPYRSTPDKIPFEKGTIVLGMLERGFSKTLELIENV